MEWQLLWKYVHTHNMAASRFYAWSGRKFMPGATSNLRPWRPPARPPPVSQQLVDVQWVSRISVSRIYFFPSHLFFAGGLVVCFRALFSARNVLLASREGHDKHEEQKPRAQLHRKVGEVDWKEVALPRFPPGLRSSWNAWFKRCKVLLSFRRERWLRRRSWLGGQCGGPACSESRCNPLLDDGGWLSGCGSCEIADKGGGLLARPAPTLDCKHHQTAALVVGNI